MKKIFTKSIITTLVCSMLVVTAAGCSNGTNAESSSSTPTETQATQAQTTTPEGVNFSLDALHAPLENPADPFAGYWRIAEGAGSKLESFTFLFNGKGGASIIVGNMGYCGKYSVGTDESTGEETFKCQLMFGINGEYSYTVAEDGKKLQLQITVKIQCLKRWIIRPLFQAHRKIRR